MFMIDLDPKFNTHDTARKWYFKIRHSNALRAPVAVSMVALYVAASLATAACGASNIPGEWLVQRTAAA